MAICTQTTRLGAPCSLPNGHRGQCREGMKPAPKPVEPKGDGKAKIKGDAGKGE